jgi:hypothetical protein
VTAEDPDNEYGTESSPTLSSSSPASTSDVTPMPSVAFSQDKETYAEESGAEPVTGRTISQVSSAPDIESSHNVSLNSDSIFPQCGRDEEPNSSPAIAMDNAQRQSLSSNTYAEINGQIYQEKSIGEFGSSFVPRQSECYQTNETELQHEPVPNSKMKTTIPVPNDNLDTSWTDVEVCIEEADANALSDVSEQHNTTLIPGNKYLDNPVSNAYSLAMDDNENGGNKNTALHYNTKSRDSGIGYILPEPPRHQADRDQHEDHKAAAGPEKMLKVNEALCHRLLSSSKITNLAKFVEDARVDSNNLRDEIREIKIKIERLESTARESTDYHKDMYKKFHELQNMVNDKFTKLTNVVHSTNIAVVEASQHEKSSLVEEAKPFLCDQPNDTKEAVTRLGVVSALAWSFGIAPVAIDVFALRFILFPRPSDAPWMKSAGFLALGCLAGYFGLKY